MDINKTEIFNTAILIMNDSLIMNSQQLDTKYSLFKEKFFRLYTTCSEVTPHTRPKIEKELTILLGIREDVKKGSKSDIEANVQVTEYMAKQYVYPITGEPSKEQKKIALSKILAAENKKNEHDNSQINE